MKPTKEVFGISTISKSIEGQALALRFLPLVMLTLPGVVQAQFAYTVNNGALTISGYAGPGGAVTIPSAVNGLPVTSIGDGAFANCHSLTSVTIPNGVTNIGSADAYYQDGAFSFCASLTHMTIPDSVTSIGEFAFLGCSSLASVTVPSRVTTIAPEAFQWCYSLTSVWFQGNAPTANSSVFSGDDFLTVYYSLATTGWMPFFANRPTALWNPQVEPGTFGVRSNQFGFTITGTPGLIVLVEACNNLGSPTWYPLRTNTLTGPFYFTDPQWTNHASRFYRVTWP